MADTGTARVDMFRWPISNQKYNGRAAKNTQHARRQSDDDQTHLNSSPLESKTRFRVQLKHAVAIGPGKADVLQAIAETGSIAESGRRLGAGYQRVWSLVRAMNNDFIEPLVLTQRRGTFCGWRGATHPDRGQGVEGLHEHRAGGP